MEWGSLITSPISKANDKRNVSLSVGKKITMSVERCVHRQQFSGPLHTIKSTISLSIWSRIFIGVQRYAPCCWSKTTSGVHQGCILAPVLFCVAVVWILSRCANSMGTTVGTSRLTHQDYADDAALFTYNADKKTSILANFEDAAQTMGLHTSWTKTKLQGIGGGPPPSPVALQLSLRTVSPTWAKVGSRIHSSGRMATS